jgi:hypothetical protein
MQLKAEGQQTVQSAQLPASLLPLWFQQTSNTPVPVPAPVL